MQLSKKQKKNTYKQKRSNLTFLTNEGNLFTGKGVIMTKLFNTLNEYFLHDSDEQASLSEYLIFYTFIGISTTSLIAYTVLNII